MAPTPHVEAHLRPGHDDDAFPPEVTADVQIHPVEDQDPGALEVPGDVQRGRRDGGIRGVLRQGDAADLVHIGARARPPRLVVAAGGAAAGAGLAVVVVAGILLGGVSGVRPFGSECEREWTCAISMP